MTMTSAKSRANKAKGRNAEAAVVEWLHANGYPHTERRRMKGANDCGDIAGIPGVVIEVKNQARIDLAGWVDELDTEIDNAAADTGALIVKRRGTGDVDDWYVVMPGRVWLALLKESGR